MMHRVTMGRDYKGPAQITVGMPNGATVDFDRLAGTVVTVEIDNPRQAKRLRAYGLTVEPAVAPPTTAKAPKKTAPDAEKE